MPGLTRRRNAIQHGEDWSKSTKGYKGGGIVHGKKGKKKRKTGGY